MPGYPERVSPLAVILLVTAIAAAAAFAIVRFGQHRERNPGDPWWRTPYLWIGVAVVFAILGVFVAPRLFGFTFLFLPFLWVGGFRRRDRREPTRDDGEWRDAA